MIYLESGHPEAAVSDMTRRALLRIGIGGGAAALLSSCDDPPRGRTSAARDARRSPVVAAEYLFLQPAEIVFVDAAVARLIPRDVLGPSGAEAGVTLFIDRQLHGPFGQAARWYMQGPFAKGTEQQGYQLQRTPAQLYRAAIGAIDTHCRTSEHETFAALSAERQDRVLHGLEKGDIDVPGVSGKEFFKMLWQNTQEGYFADPIYEGNRGFAGWRLVGFPGPRYNYVDDIRHYGQPYPWPTVGLMGRDPTRRPGSPA